MEVSYKVAQLAKEKGYFIWHPKRYVNGKLTYSPTSKYIIAVEGKRLVKPDQQQIFAPLQSELQAWLRKLDIHCSIAFSIVEQRYNCYFYHATVRDLETEVFYGDYEVVLEKGLYEALKLL